MSKNSSSSTVTSVATDHPIIRNKPMAKFRYKGTHRTPIRRTVLLTNVSRDRFTGYEVREGNELRSLEDSQIKSYTRDEIMDLERCALSVKGW